MDVGTVREENNADATEDPDFETSAERDRIAMSSSPSMSFSCGDDDDTDVEYSISVDGRDETTPEPDARCIRRPARTESGNRSTTAESDVTKPPSCFTIHAANVQIGGHCTQFTDHQSLVGSQASPLSSRQQSLDCLLTDDAHHPPSTVCGPARSCSCSRLDDVRARNSPAFPRHQSDVGNTSRRPPNPNRTPPRASPSKPDTPVHPKPNTSFSKSNRPGTNAANCQQGTPRLLRARREVQAVPVSGRRTVSPAGRLVDAATRRDLGRVRVPTPMIDRSASFDRIRDARHLPDGADSRPDSPMTPSFRDDSTTVSERSGPSPARQWSVDGCSFGLGNFRHRRRGSDLIRLDSFESPPLIPNLETMDRCLNDTSWTSQQDRMRCLIGQRQELDKLLTDQLDMAERIRIELLSRDMVESSKLPFSKWWDKLNGRYVRSCKLYRRRSDLLTQIRRLQQRLDETDRQLIELQRTFQQLMDQMALMRLHHPVRDAFTSTEHQDSASVCSLSADGSQYQTDA